QDEARADRALRPRLPLLAGARRAIGACFVLLALLLVLPFPFVSLAATAGSVVLYAIFGWLAWAALAAL
ncbi:MAG: exopolysaccharide biosynthesis protein, partial [Alphaproteobacteria bacterium]